jgi:hypothetical protein
MVEMNGIKKVTQKVLFVWPDRANNLRRAFHRAGFETLRVGSTEEGIRKVYEYHPDIVIVSDTLPPHQGKYLHQRLREIASVPCIVLGTKVDLDRVTTLEQGRLVQARRVGDGPDGLELRLTGRAASVAVGLGLTPAEHDTMRKRCQEIPLSVTDERPRFAWSADRKSQARRTYRPGERFK